MRFPKPIEDLIREMSDLPSVGPKTAERYALYLLDQPQEKLDKMARIIANLKKNTVVCGNCLSIAERNPCHICADTNRDESQICVVEGSKDIIIIENTGKFKGKYHVLGGLINTIEGVKPENLNIGQLASKSARGIEEIILALPPTIEGETTSKYIQSILKKNNMKITKLARGLPMGSNLEYTDSITMMNAFDNRN